MTIRSMKILTLPSMFLSVLVSGLFAWVLLKAGPAVPLIPAVLLLILVVALVCGGFALAFHRAVSRPLSGMVRSLEALSRGESDRLGQAGASPLLGGMPELIEGLLARYRERCEAADRTSSGVGEFSEYTRRLSFETLERLGTQSRAIGRMSEQLSSMDASQRDVQESTEMLARLIDENLSSVIQIRSSSEGIAASTADLFRSTDTAYSAVSDVSASAKEIGASMGTLSMSIEETSATLGQIAASVRVVEDAARQSSGLATEVSRMVSAEGFPAARAAREGMTNIRQEVASSSELIEKLGSRSKDIAKILAVIRDVAEQTNLLSLNASILAAQAGEHGRAFGVVADEIGSLAERTASSALEISNIVRSIQKEIADAVAGTARGMSRVEEGGMLVGKLEEALSKTLDHAERSAAMATSIQMATSEQGASVHQIEDAVTRIQDMTRQVALALRQQDGGLGLLMRNVGQVRDAAEGAKKGMEEQSSGVRAITENLTMTHEKAGQIARSMSDQRTDLDKLVKSIYEMDNVWSGIADHLKALAKEAERMSGEFRRLIPSGSLTKSP